MKTRFRLDIGIFFFRIIGNGIGYVMEKSEWNINEYESFATCVYIYTIIIRIFIIVRN